MNLIPAIIRDRIARRPNLVKIIKNIGWLFFDKLLRMGMGLIIGVWIARYLGPEQFGLLSFALAFVSIFGAVGALGLNSIVVRDIVREPGNAPLTLGTAALLHLIGSLLAFTTMLVSIYVVRDDDALARGLAAILGSTILLKFSDIAIYWFESKLQSQYTVWVQNSVFILFAVIKAFLVLNQASLTAFAWAVLGEAVVVATLLMFVLSRKGVSLSHLGANVTRAKRMLADSWPIIFSAVTVAIYTRIDQIMLGEMIGDEAVGIYTAALRLSEVWYLVPTIIVATVFPTLVTNHKYDYNRFQRNLQKLFGALVKSAVALAFIVSICSESIVSLVYGEQYVSAAGVLKWHIWGGIFVFFGAAWFRWMVIEGLQKTVALMNFMSLVANVILNLILIPPYGAVGAAIATTISYSLGHTVFALLFPNQRTAVLMFIKSFR